MLAIKPELLRTIEREYDLGTIVPVTSLGMWGEHIRWRIASSKGRSYILKERSSYLNNDEFLLHVKLHAHLDSLRSPVVPIVLARGKTPVLTWAGSLYEIHEWIESAPFGFNTTDDLRDAGKVLAAFISAAASYSGTSQERSWLYPSQRHLFAPDLCRDIVHYLAHIDRSVSPIRTWHHGLESRILLNYLHKTESKLEGVGFPQQFIHGDIQRFNFLRTHDGRQYIIDFERVHWGYRLSDIVCGCVMSGVIDAPENKPQANIRDKWNWPHVEAILNGYSSIQTLTDTEKRYFADFLGMYLIRNFIGSLDLDNAALFPPEDLLEQIDRLILLLDASQSFFI